ncbi:hypothetical protein COW98_01740 [Candidatus Roizmanbacteria bacterium CG22_combo_CG10-13_8_21_14_all_35_9]|uniref:DUF5666 domain-containing protein n=4 Tax=Candidatus Roizmaniibacteriota TaxID=1752723 RepID=A0A2M8F103_9BACT|nr:MAG: hypothetical protein COX47_01690 [Candidatus Roizmanbacteria bacterium CG23_combo_of_CG06-09_8_20_14_all_35_49]PIP62867.1 MAG: hypothetical protein COW98_01740 [Candidatus Roizmanbacteria bacterium CG22_combo_CG10-13_8_21_14_all_35_9]PIY70902.1 MAG: hypothetical protein COY88_03210 [Candidatus Roizmanbacteria bacterium CG_4_10_14_0_8_um_filter_35_28]PJC32930.1 MAG: hypothetical protein CO048_04075 [Candidatus Roizmanbacteria bacterium CG_4_9_14_0_2_um_filter_35_15]PJC82413.1 MAG: hypoth
MNKLLLYCYIVILLLTTAFVVNGQTETVVPTATSSVTLPVAEQKDIKILKEKVANKVSELRKENNKAISGRIFETETGFFKIKTQKQEEYLVKLDDALTKYYRISGNQAKEVKKEDINKNDYIIINGVVHDKTVDANSIFIDEEYLVNSGKISQVNKDSYSLKVTTSSKEEFNLDIETSTKQMILNIKTLEIETTGFSKFKEGDTVHFVVKKTGETNKDNHYSVIKILIIPQEYFIK